MNSSAYTTGESALRISGWPTMPRTPPARIATNQAIITGPNSRPMAAVPRRWTANRAMMITAVSGTIHSSRFGETNLRPSGQHRDRRGDHAVAEEQRCTEDAQGGQYHGCAAPPAQTQHECDERHDAALAVVVGAHHESDVGQRDDDHHRPKNQ